MTTQTPAEYALTKKIGLFLGPAIFLLILNLPQFSGLSPEAQRVIAVAAWMLTWWISEAVNLAVTAFLPIILFPMLQVNKMDETTQAYGDTIVFLFMGGFIIALAMEKWNLHLRIALNIVRLTGTNANGIILGFMLATGFLSMWISNTATTVMMLPIANSVIGLLANSEDLDKKGFANFSLVMMLGIAYAANIGGIGTLIGTPPNIVFASNIKKMYGYEVTFYQWFMVGFPFALCLLLLTYWVMVKWLYPNRLSTFRDSEDLINQELRKLGKMTKSEKLTLIIFVSTALLWIFRQLINLQLTAWQINLQLDDAMIAMIAAIVLFTTPTNFAKGEFLLSWKDTKNMSWGILMLFGGGIALANALAKTGIIKKIGTSVAGLEGLDNFMIMALLVALVVFMTEVMSNVALIAVIVPVIAGIAVGLGENPLWLTVPITIAASCAFMLPMATPPNAIVFSSGYVKVSQMVRAGLVLNILSIIILIVFAQTLLPYFFGIEIGKLPEWVKIK
ncbi:MAG: DASS family sodium-coupled anion symporter [Microscillaceae bacterium]|nr:DASS family sodium-coupled anion symporter [Microscillaceae bacterium]